MTQDQEIREAITVLKMCEPISVSGMDCTVKDFGKALAKAIEVLERYLSCSSMMPSKKEVGEMRYGGCNPDEDRGYNEAIEACTLAKLKEDERKEAEFEKKLEEVLTDVFAKSQLERFSKLQQIKIILTAVKERLR